MDPALRDVLELRATLPFNRDRIAERFVPGKGRAAPTDAQHARWLVLQDQGLVLAGDVGDERLPLASAARALPVDARPPVFVGDYDGEPVFVFHGAAAGRRLPEAFRAGLTRAGLRPLVVQRPGFGLTDATGGDYVTTAAADMAAVAERLKLKQAHMLARDTGAPVGLEFARSHPDLLGRAVLLNPHPPMSRRDERETFVAAVQKHLLRNPELVAAFAEFLRRQATTEVLERILDKALGEVEPDARALRDPAVRQFLIRDIQALCARSVYGFAAEHAVYANGWEPPSGLPARPWTMALSRALPGHLDPAWLGIADLRLVRIPDAGVLPQFTHPDALVGLLAG